MWENKAINDHSSYFSPNVEGEPEHGFEWTQIIIVWFIKVGLVEFFSCSCSYGKMFHSSLCRSALCFHKTGREATWLPAEGWPTRCQLTFPEATAATMFRPVNCWSKQMVAPELTVPHEDQRKPWEEGKTPARGKVGVITHMYIHFFHIIKMSKRWPDILYYYILYYAKCIKMRLDRWYSTAHTVLCVPFPWSITRNANFLIWVSSRCLTWGVWTVKSS